MKKACIYEIGNQGKFSYLVIKKEGHLLKWIDKLLYDSFGHLGDIDKEEYLDSKGDLVIKNKTIHSFVDKHETFINANARIDIYYGKNKVFVTIITTLENRKNLMDNLERMSVFKECNHNHE